MKKTMLNVGGKPMEVECLDRKAQISIQVNDPFVKRVNDLRKNGYSEKEVADILGMTVAELRKEMGKRLHEAREELIRKAKELRKAGEPTHAIAVALGVNESTTRLLLSDES